MAEPTDGLSPAAYGLRWSLVWSVETRELSCCLRAPSSQQVGGTLPHGPGATSLHSSKGQRKEGAGRTWCPVGVWPSWKHQSVCGAPPLLQVSTPGAHTLASPEETGPGHCLLPAGTLTSSAGSTPVCGGAECQTHSWSQAGVEALDSGVPALDWAPAPGPSDRAESLCKAVLPEGCGGRLVAQLLRPQAGLRRAGLWSRQV